MDPILAVLVVVVIVGGRSGTLGELAIAYDEGSFEIDTIEWRVRHVFGAQNGDPTFTYVSLGS